MDGVPPCWIWLFFACLGHANVPSGTVVTVAICAGFELYAVRPCLILIRSDRSLCRTDDIDLGFQHESYLRGR